MCEVVACENNVTFQRLVFFRSDICIFHIWSVCVYATKAVSDRKDVELDTLRGITNQTYTFLKWLWVNDIAIGQQYITHYL